MTDFPRILNTEIIDTETDIFWDNKPDITGDMQPKEVLIVSVIFDEGSAQETQLNKILEACKLNQDKYNIIQLPENAKVAWHQLKNTLQPEVVLVFGVHPRDLGISALFRLNSVNNFDGITVVPTLSLHNLEQEPQAKKDLWVNALKPLFADK